MKIAKLSVLIALLFITCSKENNSNQIRTNDVSNALTSGLDTAKVPLDDLGRKTYKDSVGGLYPDGDNNPSGDYASDLLKASKNIVPIDSFGNPDKNGRIIFIS